MRSILRKLLRFAFAGFLLTNLVCSVRADTIDFTFTGTGNIFYKQYYNMKPFQLSLRADTNNLIYDPGHNPERYFYSGLEATFSIDGAEVAQLQNLTVALYPDTILGPLVTLGGGDPAHDPFSWIWFSMTLGDLPAGYQLDANFGKFVGSYGFFIQYAINTSELYMGGPMHYSLTLFETPSDPAFQSAVVGNANVPEPATLTLLGLGLGGAWLRRVFS